MVGEPATDIDCIDSAKVARGLVLGLKNALALDFEWIEKVLDVKRWSERIMVLRVVVGRSVVNLISVYAQQTGRGKEEKYISSLL